MDSVALLIEEDDFALTEHRLIFKAIKNFIISASN